jgi:hypothetical protein
MPIPPVQGPESRPTFCDGPDPTPSRRAQSMENQESKSAGPGPVGLLWQTQAPWQTNKRINI